MNQRELEAHLARILRICEYDPLRNIWIDKAGETWFTDEYMYELKKAVGK